MPKTTSIHAANLITERNKQYHFKESHNNLGNLNKKNRTFTNYQKIEIIYQQDGKCASYLCKHKKLDPDQIQFEHKKPWTHKGRNVMQYGRAVCKECHSTILETGKTKVSKKSRTKKSMIFF